MIDSPNGDPPGATPETAATATAWGVAWLGLSGIDPNKLMPDEIEDLYAEILVFEPELREALDSAREKAQAAYPDDPEARSQWVRREIDPQWSAASTLSGRFIERWLELTSRGEQPVLAGSDHTPEGFARSQLIQVRAARFARYARVDYARVLRVLHRTAASNPLDPWPLVGVYGGTEVRLSFSPDLGEALRFRPGEDALATFESEPLDELAKRADLTAFLVDPGTPLLTLAELVDSLEAFAAHLERNRDHLLRTGYCEGSVGGSSWLAPVLGKLYPVKFAADVYELTEEGGPSRYVYTWTTRPPPRLRDPKPAPFLYHAWPAAPFHRREDGQLYDALGEPVPVCSFEAAPHLPDVTPEQVAYLEGTRPRLLDLKLRILRHLAGTGRAGDAARLWAGCLDLLTRALTQEEAQFLLWIDWLYTGMDFRGGQFTDLAGGVPTGGLSDLLGVIGHCEQELVVGQRRLVKEALAGLPAGVTLSSYYSAIGQAWRGTLDAALDRHERLETRRQEFWGEYRQRVNAALDSEFDVPIAISLRVKAKVAPQFGPYVEAFAEFQRRQYELTGAFSPLPIGEAGQTPAAAQNIFRRVGRGWMVGFGTPPVLLPDFRGLAYLHYLISHRGEDVAALDLARAAAPPNYGDDVAGAETDQRRITDEGLDSPAWAGAGAMFDSQTEDDLRREIGRLSEEHQEAREAFDEARQRELEDEIDALERYRRAGHAMGGRPRPIDEPAERARKAVSNRIRDALRNIRQVDRHLANHLDGAIRTGTFCSYNPPEPTAWQLS
jgi:hypothetical protein